MLASLDGLISIAAKVHFKVKATQIMSITQGRLREVLEYDSLTGLFIWIKRTGSRSTPGRIAGNADTSGHIQIMIDKKLFFAHRLAFLYMNGALPPDDRCVDHINGNPKDNRWDNLRIVTQFINQQNRHKPRKGAKSNLIGANWREDRKCWRSEIRINGQRINLGRFETAELAHEAYMKARSQFSG